MHFYLYYLGFGSASQGTAMATDRPSETEQQSLAASTAPSGTDARRRAALTKLGRGAAYVVPATLGLMMMPRAARAC